MDIETIVPSILSMADFAEALARYVAEQGLGQLDGQVKPACAGEGCTPAQSGGEASGQQAMGGL